MRLTLRSMLAYLDEILEPADARVIGEKIKESEFATGLVHRVRDVTRRLRLAAPKVEGPGMGLDPNTVAEYLDNTLPGERVPDFERVCLESDMHLAEVAASHQILALVLGEPAQVEPESRQRMYRLAAVDAPPEIAASSDAQSRIDRPARKRPEVPDYLRESARRSRRWAWAASAVMVVILIGLAVLLVGPSRIRELVASRPDLPERTATQAGADPAEEQEEPTPETSTSNQDATDAGPDEAGPLDAPAEENGSPLQQPVANVEVPDVGPQEESVAGADAAGPDVPVAPLPNDEPAPLPNDPLVAEGATAAADSPPPPPDDAASDSDTTEPAPAGQPEGIGRFFSEKDVLLAMSGDAQPWRRLPARSVVYPGDRLLAMPMYRPSLDFSVGARLELLGESLVELLPPDSNGVPGLEVVYGYAVLMTTANPGTQLRLRLGDREGMVTFGDAESTLAVQVRTEHSEGADPEAASGALIVDLFAVHGQIRWQLDAAVEAMSFVAPAHWNIDGRQDATTAELPEWVSRRELSYREMIATPFVEENLPTDKAVSLSLRELAESRREEVRSLAARSLALIGEFGPFVAVLNDRSNRTAWRYEIEGLREAITRSPQTAAQVRQAFLAQRGDEDGPQLYRLLWGYNQQQLAAGALEELLDKLDHEDLDFRVLAIWNLRRITGLNLPYYPDRSADERKRHIQRWRDKLPDAPAAAGPAL